MCIFSVSSFPNLGIQCVRRKEVGVAIHDRLQLGVNPFDAAVFEEDHTAIDVDLNVVRLCFEAFLPDQQGKYTQSLHPIVSNPIFDKSKINSCVLFAFLLPRIKKKIDKRLQQAIKKVYSLESFFVFAFI